MRLIVRTVAALSVASALFVASDARAAATFARVKSVVSDLYPAQGVIFKLDTGVTGCPAGSWVFYRYMAGTADDNLKAVYAALLGAYLSNSQVWVNFSSGCTVDMVRVASP